MTRDWIGRFLIDNYNESAYKLTPHGVIVMDTIMNFDKNNNSQKIPPELEENVSLYYYTISVICNFIPQ